MRKQFILLLSLGVICLASVTEAREPRTPLALFYEPSFIHYPLPRPKEDDGCMNYDIYGVGYARAADRAFVDKNSTKTESLAGPWFGSESFQGINAFAPGTIAPNDPFLAFATLAPRFDYDEKGAIFGFTIDRGFCCGERHIGLRSRMPFRYIKVDLDSCCDIQQENLDDVCRTVREQVLDEDCMPMNIGDSFAYRLDFLSSLFLTANGTNPERLVKYNQASPFIQINNINVGALQTSVNSNPAPAIHLVSKPDGAVPNVPFAETLTVDMGQTCPSVAVEPVLPSDGGNLTDGVRARFGDQTYIPLSTDMAKQAQLWVVPTARTAAGNFDIVPDGRSIQAAIESVLKGGNQDVLDFLNDNGLNFNTQRLVGAGDLVSDLYVNQVFGCNRNYFAEGILGLQFPTGKENKNPGNLLTGPLAIGNNKHWETRIGGTLGWEACDWFNMKIDAYYMHAFKRSEQVAAAFQGATVKNIGPTVRADISWNYFVGHADFTFIHPCFPLGVNVGYEPYVKSKDKVRFKQTVATDFLGNIQPLDNDVLEERTFVVAHKARTSIFYQADNFEIFGAWTHVFAGQNATRDTDWYLGLVTYF